MRLLALTAAITLVALQEEESKSPPDTWLKRLARDGRTVRLDNTEGLECAGCHQTVTEEHTIDHRSYLPVEEIVEVELDESGVKLQVRGLHSTDGLRRPQEFLDIELALE